MAGMMPTAGNHMPMPMGAMGMGGGNVGGGSGSGGGKSLPECKYAGNCRMNHPSHQHYSSHIASWSHPSPSYAPTPPHGTRPPAKGPYGPPNHMSPSYPPSSYQNGGPSPPPSAAAAPSSGKQRCPFLQGAAHSVCPMTGVDPDHMQQYDHSSPASSPSSTSLSVLLLRLSLLSITDSVHE
jgi:hypothetical protein